MAKKAETIKLMGLAQSVTDLLGGNAYLMYATSTREPQDIFGAQIAVDVLPFIAAELRTQGKVKKLVLFMHTNGGDLNAPWPIVSLLREYCDELNVVVLDRALSAGTLITISADKIIMSPDSFLSPVDPQAQVQIKGEQRGIEVEDVTGYIEFAKTKVGLTGGAGLEKAFQDLTQEIPPTLIGSLFRTHTLIRSLASKIINTRKVKLDSSSEKQIVESLTEKLFSHRHLISRSEAKNYVGLGDTIVFAKAETETKINELKEQLFKIMGTKQMFNPVKLLGTKDAHTERAPKALILSPTCMHVYDAEVIIQKSGNDLSVNVNPLGWEKEE